MWHMEISTSSRRASYVRALIGWHGMTGTQLADVLKISQPAASKKLLGQRRFTVDELVTLAEHFEVDPGLLLKPDPVAPFMGTVREQLTGLVRSTFCRFRRWWASRYANPRVDCRSCVVDLLTA